MWWAGGWCRAGLPTQALTVEWSAFSSLHRRAAATTRTTTGIRSSRNHDKTPLWTTWHTAIITHLPALDIKIRQKGKASPPQSITRPGCHFSLTDSDRSQQTGKRAKKRAKLSKIVHQITKKERNGPLNDSITKWIKIYVYTLVLRSFGFQRHWDIETLPVPGRLGAGRNCKSVNTKIILN